MGFFNTLSKVASGAKKSMENAYEGKLKEIWPKIDQKTNDSLIRHLNTVSMEDISKVSTLLAFIKLYSINEYDYEKSVSAVAKASNEEKARIQDTLFRFCKKDSLRLSEARELRNLKDITAKFISEKQK